MLRGWRIATYYVVSTWSLSTYNWPQWFGRFPWFWFMMYVHISLVSLEYSSKRSYCFMCMRVDFLF